MAQFPEDSRTVAKQYHFPKVALKYGKYVVSLEKENGHQIAHTPLYVLPAKRIS